MGRGLVSTRVVGQTDNNGNLSPRTASVFIVNKPSFVINLVLDSPRLSNERPVSLEPCNFSSLVMLLPMKSLYLWRKFRHEMICRGLYHLL